MLKYCYEIYLGSPTLGAEAWQDLLIAIQKYLGLSKPWRLMALREDATLHFYVESNVLLPTSFDVPNFLLKIVDNPLVNLAVNPRLARPFFLKAPTNLAELFGKLYKKNQEFDYLEIGFQVFPKRPFASATVVFDGKTQKLSSGFLNNEI